MLTTASKPPQDDPDSRNLLPLANPELKFPTGRAYVREGMSRVPAKLEQKIRHWEYVEMGELLPEFWAAETRAKTRQPVRGGLGIRRTTGRTRAHGVPESNIENQPGL